MKCKVGIGNCGDSFNTTVSNGISSGNCFTLNPEGNYTLWRLSKLIIVHQSLGSFEPPFPGTMAALDIEIYLNKDQVPMTMNNDKVLIDNNLHVASYCIS